MIEFLPAVSLKTLPAAPTAAVPGSAIGIPPNSFGQTLGTFLDANDAEPLQAAALAGTGQRQAVADDGKDLPGTASQDDSQDADTHGGDTGDVPAWFPVFLLPALAPPPVKPALAGGSPIADTPVASTATSLPAAPAIVSLPCTAASSTDVAEAAQSLTQPVPPRSDIAAKTVAARPAPRTPTATVAVPPPEPRIITPDAPASALPTPNAYPVSAAPTSDTMISVASRASVTARAPTVDTLRAAVAADAPPAAAGADPASQAIPVSATPQPAGQVFAAAIATATSWRARATRIGEREPTDATAVLPAVAQTADGERAIVTATSDAQDGALDLTRDTGLQHVIDRIETLRDDADSRDTRVRLTPDALGSVDVAVRQEGDRVHVRFTAEQDATRALIAEAQPRLNELAVARGVRIGETSVGTGAGGGGTPQQPQTQATPRFARAPVPAAATDSDSITDTRLA